MVGVNNKYRWKSKRVSKKKYDVLLRAQKMGRKNTKRQVENDDSLSTNETEMEILKETDTDNEEGNIDPPENAEPEEDLSSKRRIVDLKYLGEQLWCCECEETLSLSNIEQEIRRGVVS